MQHGVQDSLPDLFETSSVPPMSVKGFTKEQVKSMASLWNSPAKLVEILLMVVVLYTNSEADVNRVTEILSSLLEINVIFPLLFKLSNSSCPTRQKPFLSLQNQIGIRWYQGVMRGEST